MLRLAIGQRGCEVAAAWGGDPIFVDDRRRVESLFVSATTVETIGAARRVERNPTSPWKNWFFVQGGVGSEPERLDWTDGWLKKAPETRAFGVVPGTKYADGVDAAAKAWFVDEFFEDVLRKSMESMDVVKFVDLVSDSNWFGGVCRATADSLREDFGVRDFGVLLVDPYVDGDVVASFLHDDLVPCSSGLNVSKSTHFSKTERLTGMHVEGVASHALIPEKGEFVVAKENVEFSYGKNLVDYLRVASSACEDDEAKETLLQEMDEFA